MLRTTERLVLREFRADDWPAVLSYQSDARYLRYYPATAANEREVRALVDQFLAWQIEVPRWRWQLAIILPAEERLIGNCGLRLDAPGARTGNLGYELDPACWGHGYATEAACEMLRFGFDELGLERIWAWCIAENAASVRVLERLGLQREASLHPEWFKGRWWDRVRYGLDFRGWRAASKDLGPSPVR